MKHRLSLLALVALAGALAAPVSAEIVVLMPESTNKTVQKFDPNTGAHLGTFLGPDDANLTTPQDCEVNATGVLVSDQVDDAIRQYNFAGTFLGTFASPIDNLRCITAHNGRIYATASTRDAIEMYDQDTGAPLGDFIAPGVGGLNGPWDILFRTEGDVLVTSIDSDNILRYDINGNPLGVFAAGFPFGEQMYQAANGNILVADFTRNVIAELDPSGAEIRALTGVGGPRGCYELANGNVLTTNASGVHEIDRIAGGIVSTKLSGVSARMLARVNLEPPVAVEPATWGGIKAQFK